MPGAAVLGTLDWKRPGLRRHELHRHGCASLWNRRLHLELRDRDAVRRVRRAEGEGHVIALGDFEDRRLEAIARGRDLDDLRRTVVGPPGPAAHEHGETENASR